MPVELISPSDDAYTEVVKRHNAQPKVGATRRQNGAIYEEVMASYNAAQIGVLIRFQLKGRVTSGNIVKVFENRGLKSYEDFEISRDTTVEADHPAELPVVILKLSEKTMRSAKERHHTPR